MEILILCFTLLLLLNPSSSLRFTHLLQSHHQLQDEVFLSRKLKFSEQLTVKQHERQDIATYQHTKLPSGKAKHKEQNMKQYGGRQGRWVNEEADASEFFTMDYTHVRRRRPIHNKSLPFAP